MTLALFQKSPRTLGIANIAWQLIQRRKNAALAAVADTEMFETPSTNMSQYYMVC